MEAVNTQSDQPATAGLNSQSDEDAPSRVIRVEIVPDVSLLRKTGEVNYSIPQSIFELVDNSVDERIPGQPVTVDIHLGQRGGRKVISVTDDASGMSSEELAEAMTMARSHKSGGQIGEFGLGLKAAVSFLGCHVEIVTCRTHDTVASRLVYDETEFIERGEWALEIEEVLKPFPNGTRIEVSELKVNLYAGVKNTVLENMGKTFRHFITNGEAQLRVNGTDATPYEYATIPEYDTEIDFEIEGRRVRGWASLAVRGSGRGMYGFSLIRHNRVMAEYVKLGFPASASHTRMIGELHLDDFPVVNNKTAFRVGTREWDRLQKAVRERINDLLRANRRMANPGKQMSPKDKADVDEFADKVEELARDQGLISDIDRRALDSELEDDVFEGPVPLDPGGDDEDGDGSQASSDADSDDRDRGGSYVMRHRLNRVKTTLRSIKIEHQIARLGRDSSYKIWDVEGVGDRKRLVVTTNSDHPFFEVIGDGLLLWIKHNIVEAVAEYITEQTGTAESMLLMKSDILKHVGRIDLAVLDEEPWNDGEEELQEIA